MALTPSFHSQAEAVAPAAMGVTITAAAYGSSSLQEALWSKFIPNKFDSPVPDH